MRYLAFVLLVLGLPVTAQSPGSIIRTAGTGEVTLAPDWALVLLGVSSRGTTASEASRATARAVNAVWEAVVRVGVPRDSVKTMSSGVQPVIDYQNDRRVTGYLAQVMVQVPVRDLARLGAVIDGALAAGATELQQVQPRSSREHEVRAEVLAMAVARARSDAEALATAAGGRLGPLVELSSDAAASPGPPEAMMMRAAEAGPALPDLVVRAGVSAVWRYYAARR